MIRLPPLPPGSGLTRPVPGVTYVCHEALVGAAGQAERALVALRAEARDHMVT